MMKQKREYIMGVLRDNPDKWMTAQEIALQCLGGRFTSSRDVGNMLTCETHVERKNISPRPGRILLAYRYAEGGNA